MLTVPPRAALAALLLAMLAFVLALGGCTTLPPLPARTASGAYADTGATALGRAARELAAPHPGLSGIHPLADGHDAFAVRLLLAEHAERSLDVQYYIWRDDTTGMLLLEALRGAARRGVRVRLLLDDNNTAGMDGLLSALAAEANVEVRLFNPFASRGSRVLGYLTDFARLNRRMHNKSFTADGAVTVVGGRNVGDAYFGAAGDVLFADLDVMALGPVAADVGADFDRYWNSQSAWPVTALVKPPAKPAAAGVPDPAAARGYLATVRASTFVQDLAARRLPLDWAPVRLVSDDPAKVLGQARDGSLVSDKLVRLMGDPARTLDLVSPYFVPGAQGTAALAALSRRGVHVTVLTNALEATDVGAVHAGYAKRRRPLLEAGVRLYELRRAWSADGAADGARRGLPGSSGASLHAKTFVADGTRVFVGSFNFDPRSVDLNTELGFVIDSPALARRLEQGLAERLPGRTYQVELGPDGALRWIETGGGAVHRTEPGTGFWQRLGVDVLTLLPIDWLL